MSGAIRNPHDPLAIGSHRLDYIHGGDGEEWHIVCECQWEVWGSRTEEEARNAHARHVIAAEDWNSPWRDG